MREGPRTASISGPSAATITCPAGAAWTRGPAWRSHAPARPFRLPPRRGCGVHARGDPDPCPFRSRGEPFEEAGEVADGLEVVIEADPLVRGVEAALHVRHAARHDGRYPEPGDHERGRTAPPDGRVHDGLVAAEVPPSLYRRLDDGGVDGRLGRLDPVQVDHLDVVETAPLQVRPDQPEHGFRALARYEAEVHLHERLGRHDGLGTRTRVSGLYSRYVRGRAQEHLAQRVLAGEAAIERLHFPGGP